jgi:hypothetical protein
MLATQRRENFGNDVVVARKGVTAVRRNGLMVVGGGRGKGGCDMACRETCRGDEGHDRDDSGWLLAAQRKARWLEKGGSFPS